MEDLVATNPGGIPAGEHVVDQMIHFAATHKPDNDASLKKLQVKWLKRRKDDLSAEMKWPMPLNPFEER